MYSLYRAWLSLGPPCPLPQLPPPAPLNFPAPPAHCTGAPDVALHVGPTMTQFSAHRAVLSAHSGFFKAALLNHTGGCKHAIAFLLWLHRRSEEPSVTSVTCYWKKSALADVVPTPIIVSNVNVDEFSSLLTFMYTGYLDLNLSNIYNILLATHILHMPRALEICRNFLLQNQPQIETHPCIIKPIPSRKTALPTQQIYTPAAVTSLQKSEETSFRVVASKNEQASTSKKEENDKETLKPSASNAKQEKKRKRESNGDKVIIDIACCDGPVRFHRVINKNYGQNIQSENVYEMQEINKNLNKVMNENIRDQMTTDENQAGNSAEMFTCLYCNHTFKSQYCYQKHARRHLNPVSLEVKNPPKENKREVKLLDMNVQYYPCKTCGSKFPSYYFVHKHRKLCHAEEMADSTNKNNEMAPENNDSGSVIDVEAVNDS